MAIIHKKIRPIYFSAIASGVKKFELRKDEDNISVGDIVYLHEYDGEYTGRFLSVKVEYVLRDCEEYGLRSGYCIFGFRWR